MDDDNSSSDTGSGSENENYIENGARPLSSEEVSGRRKVEPRREGRPGAEGEGRDCGLGEGMRTEDTKGTRAEGGAAPRVTLIADVWHPDLSER